MDENPLDGRLRKRNEAAERATLITHVVVESIRTRGDGCRLPPQCGGDPFEEIGRPAVVGIEEGDQGHIADGGKTGISRRRRAFTGPPEQHHAERAAVIAYPRVDAFSGAVRRTVVHNDDRSGRVRLRLDALQATQDEPGAIPDWNNNADGEIRRAHLLTIIGMARLLCSDVAGSSARQRTFNGNLA